ncbi:EAL domain-containing protein [Lentibacillus cibarius]|uniref:EAL domain-containing protein n=1 Tax=Lentibacillus cibarius TaxID=2583219 RepID=A0A5S3QLN5_9BACI|nr:EAL domain-containing protein [Lentibacillus cibarius]TMN22668.1 EAL domain-containing protein [Lentibacillus cibarius]
MCLPIDTSKFLRGFETNYSGNKLEPEFLELEITESLMLDATYAAFILKELKKIGVSISIDDFGTGYSSLSSINQLPIDRIKIDKTFINSMLSNSKEKTLVKAMVEMGRNLNVELVAEGVEYEEQEKALRDLKCHMGQGYLYSPPVSINEIENMLTLVKVESTVI